jgi:hypothetical protein
VQSQLSRKPYPEGYIVSKRWHAILAIQMKEAAKATDPVDLVLMGMNMFDLPPEIVTPERAEYLRAARAAFVARTPELAPINESPLADYDAVAMEDDGATFSAKMEQAFQYYEDIKAGVEDISKMKVVVEIGTGFGRFARLLHLLDRSRC